MTSGTGCVDRLLLIGMDSIIIVTNIFELKIGLHANLFNFFCVRQSASRGQTFTKLVQYQQVRKDKTDQSSKSLIKNITKVHPGVFHKTSHCIQLPMPLIKINWQPFSANSCSQVTAINVNSTSNSMFDSEFKLFEVSI